MLQFCNTLRVAEKYRYYKKLTTLDRCRNAKNVQIDTTLYLYRNVKTAIFAFRQGKTLSPNVHTVSKTTLSKYHAKWCVAIGKTALFAFRQGNSLLPNRLTYTYVRDGETKGC